MHLMVGATHHFGVFQIVDLVRGHLDYEMGCFYLIFYFANGFHKIDDLDWIIALGPLDRKSGPVIQRATHV